MILVNDYVILPATNLPFLTNIFLALSVVTALPLSNHNSPNINIVSNSGKSISIVIIYSNDIVTFSPAYGNLLFGHIETSDHFFYIFGASPI